ncbi:TOM complex receptor protein TOM20 [Ascoidea rubescens DSM 1968]|uniref:Mitochondrial import receptor subunit TOM20 n=1 Tax=Ascoidea rubescens DSM 1968 TaxID=1344418 RepID=A0A1D2VR36_9ASCO|nr:protein import receptor MAS20 [Ascoidea rubescens DSM 1968]ODV64072.1 protein import receptor MAS20 [Ascoidea rubescens DSM 1968]
MSKTTVISSLTLTAFVCYLVYFDYNRRHSVEFRKKLKKTKKNHYKQQLKSKQNAKKVKLEQIKSRLLKSLADEPIPTDLTDKEQIFINHVGKGEQLAAVAGKEIDSALNFYRALAVYPNPTDLLSIYQRTVPENIYEIVVSMIAIQPPNTVVNILRDSISSLDQD